MSCNAGVQVSLDMACCCSSVIGVVLSGCARTDGGVSVQCWDPWLNA